MAVIPKTVGEVVDYLSTYPRDMMIFDFDDDNGYFWTFSFDTETIELSLGNPFEVLLIERFRTYDPFNPS